MRPDNRPLTILAPREKSGDGEQQGIRLRRDNAVKARGNDHRCADSIRFNLKSDSASHALWFDDKVTSKPLLACRTVRTFFLFCFPERALVREQGFSRWPARPPARPR